MCGRFTQLFPGAPEAQAQLAALMQRWVLPPRYNLAPTQLAGVIRQAQDGLELASLSWGLVPSWSDHGARTFSTINARIESVAEKPAYRAAFRQRRCLVPMSGYYEWVDTGSGKQPYYLSDPTGRTLWVAGIWERWSRGEAALESFSVLTRPAEGGAADIHDRMPAILPSMIALEWIHASVAAAGALLATAPTPELKGRAVGRRVNAVRNDDATLIEPPPGS